MKVSEHCTHIWNHQNYTIHISSFISTGCLELTRMNKHKVDSGSWKGGIVLPLGSEVAWWRVFLCTRYSWESLDPWEKAWGDQRHTHMLCAKVAKFISCQSLLTNKAFSLPRWGSESVISPSYRPHARTHNRWVTPKNIATSVLEHNRCLGIWVKDDWLR